MKKRIFFRSADFSPLRQRNKVRAPFFFRTADFSPPHQRNKFRAPLSRARAPFLVLVLLLLATLACGQSGPVTPFPAREERASDSGKTIYGFFPSPPKATLTSVLAHFKDLGQYADFVLFQHNVPWDEFVDGAEGESKSRTDIANQEILARQNGLDSVYVVDPLNGLNRREFKGLPEGWEASFANPDVRAAFTNYTLWVVRNFHPRYLGLASEINTYLDAFPEDAANFVSLYHEVYALVKAESPDTQVFVTFQWDDLNNMWAQPEEGHGPPLTVNWEQVDAFEPNLDLWVISSYPYFVFPSGADIPADYYSRLLDRTDKPVAVAEGGWTSRDLGEIHATPEDQVAYLNAIHDQLGSRLAFWVYLVLNDFDMESYANFDANQNVSETDMNTLSMFASLGLREMDGTPKPALEVWMGFRGQKWAKQFPYGFQPIVSLGQQILLRHFE